MSVKERLLHLQKFEWGKVTDDCLSQLNVGHAREILAEIDRLERERDGLRGLVTEAIEQHVDQPRGFEDWDGNAENDWVARARTALRSPEDK